MHLCKEDYEVRTVPMATCEDLVARHHYAKGGSNTAAFRHGLFLRAKPFDCLGVAWWIPPTRSTAEASFDGDWRQVLCLSRLVLVPGLPTNAASYLIGESIKRIKKAGGWRCLLTYADIWQGHTGTIYRATNWEYLGTTEPTPTYVDVSGRMVARKAGPHTRTHAEMLALGHRCLGSFSKHKFRMVINAAVNEQPSMFALEGV